MRFLLTPVISEADEILNVFFSIVPTSYVFDVRESIPVPLPMRRLDKWGEGHGVGVYEVGRILTGGFL
jgi:hypothetical protein